MEIDEARTLARMIADTRPRGRWPELNVSEFAVLLYVGACACAFDDLCTTLDAAHERASVWTRTLEAMGLLSKRPDPNDLRRVLLFVTAKGRRMLASARKPALPMADTAGDETTATEEGDR